MNDPERVYFSVDRDRERLTATSPDEAISDWYDDLPEVDGVPETVTVYEFHPVSVRVSAERVLERLLEDLDEEYADPDGDYTEPTEKMRKAAVAFVEAVVEDYQSWSCECVGSEDYNVREALG